MQHRNDPEIEAAFAAIHRGADLVGKSADFRRAAMSCTDWERSHRYRRAADFISAKGQKLMFQATARLGEFFGIDQAGKGKS